MDEIRCRISPVAAPPSVVFRTSLVEGYWFSAKYSQIRLPAAAKTADSQNSNPFERAAEK